MVPDAKRAGFKRYLVPGKPGYVPHHWATLADAVGLDPAMRAERAVIAHPGRYGSRPARCDALLEEFRDAGGAGLEVVTGNHSPDQYAMFAELALEPGFLASRGSDFHGPGESSDRLRHAAAARRGLTPVWHDARSEPMAQYFSDSSDAPAAAPDPAGGGDRARRRRDRLSDRLVLRARLPSRRQGGDGAHARIRGIDERHHLTLVCRDLSEIATTRASTTSQFRLLKAATPGSYTFILQATREVPRRLLHPTRKTIGLRVPDHPVAHALLAELGEPCCRRR